MTAMTSITGVATRRRFLAAGFSAVSAVLCNPDAAEAGVLPSLTFPENEGLTESQVADRFAFINDHYSLGEAFSDNDVDFVLRYGAPVPGATAIDGGAGSELAFNFSAIGDYLGSFAYEISSNTEVSNASQNDLDVTIGRVLTAYGWISPLQGSRGMCNYGLIYKTPEDARRSTIRIKPNSVGFSQGLDQVVGIANACHIDITVAAD